MDYKWLYIYLVLILMGCTSHENEVYSGLGRMSFDVTINDVEGATSSRPLSLYLMSADGEYSHTWPYIADFPSYESFHVGSYTAVAYSGTEGSEGYGCPYYAATSTFAVKDSEETHITLDCQLAQAMMRVKCGTSTSDRYRVTDCIVHTSNYGYLSAVLDNSGYMFLQPGDTYIYVSIADDTGKVVNVVPDLLIETKSGVKYDVDVRIDDKDNLLVNCGQQTSSLLLSEALFNSTPPDVLCSGFVDNEVLHLTEGFPAEMPVTMTVNAAAGIKSMIMSFNTVPYKTGDIPREFNLLDPNSIVYQYGLDCQMRGDTGAVIDYTSMLESLKGEDNEDLYLTLQVMDKLGRVSTPVVLHVMLKTVDIVVAEVTPAVIGIDTTSITLAINVPKVDINDITLVNDKDGIEQPIKVDSGTLDEVNQTVTLNFTVPQGVDPVTIGVDYMGLKKLEAIVPRKVPEFKLKTDAFATQLRLSIVGANAQITSAITRYSSISIKDTEFAVTSRDIDKGLIICTGLNPSTKYEVKASVIRGDNDQTVAFVTEAASQLPDGDFEDAALDITYDHLASGGVYSTTSFPIFNRQNFIDVNIYWPKKAWSSINAKTFCRNVTNRNTWFMQPSAYVDYGTSSSGSKSMCITSVGWSLEGTDIPPYVQQDDAYQPYSGNMPPIANISAGYLFLGKYAFNLTDKTESYAEGMNFSSRPSSLNGFYKYAADVNVTDDNGWCNVELIHTAADGKEVIIASGYMEFTKASYFRSFNLPLFYNTYDLKADKVKVIFCSSSLSDGLTYDDPEVPVSANVSEGCYRGSTLWIDNLSFSY